MRLPGLQTRLHRKPHPAVCTISGRHHVVFVLAPFGRRYVEQCLWCGRTWDLDQGQVPSVALRRPGRVRPA